MLLRFFLCLTLICSLGGQASSQARSSELMIRKLNPELSDTGIVDSVLIVTDTAIYFRSQATPTSPWVLYRASLVGSSPAQPLSNPNHSVVEFKLSANEQTLVYVTDVDQQQNMQVYSVDLQTRAIQHLAYPESAGDAITIEGWELSQDGQVVIFTTLAHAGIDNLFNLYSFNVDGTLLAHLDAQHPNLFLVSLPVFTSDGANVLFVGIGDSAWHLYNSAITSTNPLTLYSSLDSQTGISNLQLYQDQRVFFSTGFELREVPITGGTSTLVHPHHFYADLAGDLLIVSGDWDANTFGDVLLHDVQTGVTTSISAENEYVTYLYDHPSFGFAPDGQSLMYTSTTPAVNQQFTSHLHSFNLSKQTSTQLASFDNGLILPTHSQDSAHVIYQTFEDGVFSEPFKVARTGGVATPLITNPLPNALYFHHQESLDNSWLYLLITTDATKHLYRVPTAGGALEHLNGELVAGGNVISVHPTRTGVAYVADAEVDQKLELYLVGEPVTPIFLPVIQR